MTKPVKFFFDENFEAERKRPAKPDPLADIKQAHARELASAREAGEDAARKAYQEGFEEGQREGMGSIEAQLSATLGAIAAQVALVMNQRQSLEQALMRDAVALAMSMARQLAPALIMRQPLAEIEALIHDCLDLGNREPRIVIRIAEDLVEPLRERLEPIKATHNFTGDIILLGEPDMPRGDCRVEWPDGGAERSLSDADTKMAEAVERFLAARGAAPSDSGDAETLSVEHEHALKRAGA